MLNLTLIKLMLISWHEKDKKRHTTCGHLLITIRLHVINPMKMKRFILTQTFRQQI